MTIIEKIYAGEKLTKEELRYLATGFSYENIEAGDYTKVDEIEGEIGGWTQDIQTIIRVGEDLWSIDWDKGLTEKQDSLFYEQPYRVEKKEKIITIPYYVKI